MIELIGPPWPSMHKLHELVQTLPGDLVVCWGGQGVVGALNGGRRLDGVEQLEVFRNAGIKAPEFTTDFHRAFEWCVDGSLVFGRQRLHTHGRDIVGPRHRRWSRSEYWVKVIGECRDEWRIHVFQGRSIARGLKVMVEEPWRRMPVRSRSNGWHLAHGPEPPEGLRTLAKQAVAACGYDFAGVDLVVQEDGTQWVLECNRAVGMDNKTAAAYAKAIGRAARQ